MDARGGAGGGHSAVHALVRVDVCLNRGVAAGVENLAADDLGDGGGRLLLQVLSLRMDGQDGDGSEGVSGDFRKSDFKMQKSEIRCNVLKCNYNEFSMEEQHHCKSHCKITVVTL